MRVILEAPLMNVEQESSTNNATFKATNEESIVMILLRCSQKSVRNATHVKISVIFTEIENQRI